MKELFRTNLYVADNDSVNTNYSTEEYIRRFKSSLLMAKSIGMNPNMIFDSNGFSNVVNDTTIKKFFVKRINELNNNGIEYCIKIHIFNNYVENDYFDNTKENPFERYYNEKINDTYLFSSYQSVKNDLQKNSALKYKVQQRLEAINSFSKHIYNKTGQNIFKVHNNEFSILRESTLNRIELSIRNIKNTNEKDKVEYLKLLTDLMEIISKDKEIKNRTDLYSLLTTNDLKKMYSFSLLEQIRSDIIDIAYNSSFISKGEIFRYKSVDSIDKIYAKTFDSYTNEDKIFKLYKLYDTFDKVKSKIEILELFVNPTKIIDYLTDELMNSVEDKGISTMHNIASYLIPKTRLMGVANSNDLLIGVK